MCQKGTLDDLMKSCAVLHKKCKFRVVFLKIVKVGVFRSFEVFHRFRVPDGLKILILKTVLVTVLSPKLCWRPQHQNFTVFCTKHVLYTLLGACVVVVEIDCYGF